MIQLQIETTSVCGAHCVFCIYPAVSADLARKGVRRNMDLGLYERILDEASTIPEISQVCLTGLGDPLLDRHLEHRVRYARERLPKTFIDIYTQGTWLTPARFDDLKSAGISCVSISLNGVTKEQRKLQMGLDDFDKVCENIEYAISHANGRVPPVMILVKAVFSSDVFTQDDVNEFYRRWGHRDAGGFGSLVVEGNWAGDNRLVADGRRPFKPNEACHRALGQIYVTAEGKVTPCCFMPVPTVVFGDLTKQTIREVYSSPEYLKFREAHFADQADKYEFCKNCTRI